MKNGILETVEQYGDLTVTGTNITGAITTVQEIKNTVKGYWKWGTDDKSKSSIVLGTGRLGLVIAGPSSTFRIQQLKSKEVVLVMDEYQKTDDVYPGIISSYEWKGYTKIVLTPNE